MGKEKNRQKSTVVVKKGRCKIVKSQILSKARNFLFFYFLFQQIKKLIVKAISSAISYTIICFLIYFFMRNQGSTKAYRLRLRCRTLSSLVANTESDYQIPFVVEISYLTDITSVSSFPRPELY